MKIYFALLGLAGSVYAQTQTPVSAPAQAPAPRQGPIITWEDANDQDYYGYNGYYYGGGCH